MKPVKSFIGQPAPVGYVAGVGRGATGFTTRSDIGPAREYYSDKPKKPTKNEDSDDEVFADSNYDNFAGYKGSLFGKGPYEQEDEEADLIYKSIDKHIDERSKAQEATKTKKVDKEVDVQEVKKEFEDVKQELKNITEEDWMNIPEVGDQRNRKQRAARQVKITPIPDSLLKHQAALASGGEHYVYLDPTNGEESTMIPGTSTNPNLGRMGEIRSAYITMKLNQISDSATGQTVVDPQGYLTELKAQSNVLQMNDAQVVKNSEKLYRSILASNPNQPLVWIALGNLKEKAGKVSAAKSILLTGCEKCPKDVNLWLEAAKLHPRDEARAILVRAIQQCPTSVALWMKAADIEKKEDDKKRVYVKSVEAVPSSKLLWQKLVEYSKPEDVCKILREAVTNCPQSVDLWIELAKHEPYENAKKLLNEARELNPSDKKIWIAASKLEETNGKHKMVEKIVRRTLSDLASQGIVIGRDDWMKEAISCNITGHLKTCQEIVKQVLERCLADEDSEEDSDQFYDLCLDHVRCFMVEKAYECARTVFKFLVQIPTHGKKESLWVLFVDFERKYGTKETLEATLRDAVCPDNCVNSVKLWLYLAEVKSYDLEEARAIISNALDMNPDSEQIIIAAVQLEHKNNNINEARRILRDACLSAKTAALVQEWAKIEREQGEVDRALELLSKGIEDFNTFPELFLMIGDLEEEKKHNEAAKEYYRKGLKFNRNCSDLWIAMAKLEEKLGSVPRARSLLEEAKKRNRNDVRLWLEAARVEIRAGKRDLATTILAKAIRECRQSSDLPLLESEYEALKPRTKKQRVQFKI